ncbi:MAG: hypothetical protein LBI87_11180 [Candidatus Accumulibacter sp.]|jgi:hypothetical protein|nr:hypothetical protein [Accumulibacter sp.]
MTHSLRAIVRCMLLVWFALAIAMAMALKIHLPSETAGTLVENLFSRPEAPPPESVLKKEAPRPVPAPAPKIVPKPAPVPPPDAAWRKLEHGRGGGTGRLGAPEIVERADGTIELDFPFQGTPGEIGFYRQDKKGALSVDLYGNFSLQRTFDQVLAKGLLHRLQIYPHPGFIRISGMARQQTPSPRLDAAAFASQDRLRVVFALGHTPPAPTPPADGTNHKETPGAPPVAPL